MTPRSALPLAPTLRRNLIGIGLRVAGMALLATVSGLVKWCGEQGVHLFEVIFFRNAVAFIPICIYIARTTGFGALRTSNPRGHAARAAAGLVGMMGGFGALYFLPLTEAVALGFATPLIMTALSAPILREPIGMHRWGAVIVGFIGVLIMIRPDPNHMNMTGAAIALAGAFGAAGAMVTVRQLGRTEPSSAIVFYFTLAGAIVGLASLPFGWVVPDLKVLAALIMMGLVAGVMQILNTEAMRLAPVGVVAPFDYSQLLWAGLIGYLIWGELPRSTTLAGAAVVAASGVYILYRELRRFRGPAR